MNIEEANPEALVFSLRRVYEFLPSDEQSRFLHEIPIYRRVEVALTSCFTETGFTRALRIRVRACLSTG